MPVSVYLVSVCLSLIKGLVLSSIEYQRKNHMEKKMASWLSLAAQMALAFSAGPDREHLGFLSRVPQVA